jgi:hypothetical protein
MLKSADVARLSLPKGPEMTKPKTPADEADFDPAAVLKQIALDGTQPAGARVAAARSLLIAAGNAKAGKANPETAETRAAAATNRAALRLIGGQRSG